MTETIKWNPAEMEPSATGEYLITARTDRGQFVEMGRFYKGDCGRFGGGWTDYGVNTLKRNRWELVAWAELPKGPPPLFAPEEMPIKGPWRP